MISPVFFGCNPASLLLMETSYYSRIEQRETQLEKDAAYRCRVSERVTFAIQHDVKSTEHHLGWVPRHALGKISAQPSSECCPVDNCIKRSNIILARMVGLKFHSSMLMRIGAFVVAYGLFETGLDRALWVLKESRCGKWCRVIGEKRGEREILIDGAQLLHPLHTAQAKFDLECSEHRQGGSIAGHGAHDACGGGSLCASQGRKVGHLFARTGRVG